MKTLTIDQFKKLVSDNAHRLETTYEKIEDRYNEKWGENTVVGWVYNTLTMPGMTITYQNKYEYVADDLGAIELSDKQPVIWVIKNCEFNVVDEENKKLNTHEIGDIVFELTCIFDFDLRVLE